MRLDAITIGINPPDDVNVVIEVPIGGEPIKYEMDKAAGTLVVDRFLHTPMRYPGNYGFVPHTLSQDGDPIDVLVANTRPIFPGAVINVRLTRWDRRKSLVLKPILAASALAATSLGKWWAPMDLIHPAWAHRSMR